MKRVRAIAGSTLFLLLAPGAVVGLVPWLICRWRVRPALLGWTALPAIGMALLLLGGAWLLDSFARFALQGLGTPAPMAPPSRLVVAGWYRRVRNPMYVALVSLILGQALWFGSAALLGYGLAVWLAAHLTVLAYEEPKLRTSFGEEYGEYCANVPRWIPRLRAWRP